MRKRKKKEKRLRITRRREKAIEEEEKGRSWGYRYFKEMRMTAQKENCKVRKVPTTRYQVYSKYTKRQK